MHYKFPNSAIYTYSLQVVRFIFPITTSNKQAQSMKPFAQIRGSYIHVHHPVILMTAYFSIDHTNVEMEKNAETKILH